jgi:tetratricopeptide (TPR) repeat protein
MFCPHCGTDAGDAKFCPECGTSLAELAPRKPPAKAAPATGLSPTTLWIVIGIAAAVVVVAVIILAGSFSNKKATSADTSSGSIAADTSGTYAELVTRANGLYDQGDAAFMSNSADSSTRAAEYFSAAATVYAAALQKQPGDPKVRTDYATSLFYSGQTDAALKQVTQILKDNPVFQPALLNEGIFLTHKGQFAQQAGQKAEARAWFAKGKVALTKAIAIDPNSSLAKESRQLLDMTNKALAGLK